MEKLLNYIKNGRGHGFIFLTAVSVLITTFFMITLKASYTEIKPKIELIAQDFLPLTVTNKEISSPLDTYKRLELVLDDHSNSGIPVILNTTSTYKELPKIDLGIYIAKDNFYLITPKEIKKLNYEDGIYDTARFGSLMTKIETMLSTSISFIMIIILFINFAIKSLITMLLSMLIIKLKKIPALPKAELMRLSCLITASIELISLVIAKIAQYELNIFLFYFISASVAFVYITTQTPKDDNLPL